MYHHVVIWFKMKTKDMTDDSTYLTGEQRFEITGTKTYKTPNGGSKKVLLGEPIQ